MCRLTSKDRNHERRNGSGGREISTELLENVEPGDYVMVHAGIAIAKIQEDEEEEADEILEELL